MIHGISVTDVTLLIGRFLPEPHAGLLSGMLFGTRQSLSDGLYESLVDSGTLHIVALSGTNITILISLVFTVCSRFFTRRSASILAVIIIIGFVWFVGPSPTVVRAAIMGCLALIAQMAGRQVWALWSLFITFLIMVAFRPGLVSDISFQLSVGATLGLILFAGHPPASRTPSFWQSVRDAVMDDLKVTLAAQVFTIPLTVMHFRRLSLISPVTNLLIGWVLAPITGAGMLFVMTGFVIPPLAVPVSYGLWVGLEYVIRVVMLTARVPFASVSW